MIQELFGQTLRGLAAMLVVFFHLPGWNPIVYDNQIIRNGYLMVDLFFVLSGFVIYRNYAERISSLSDLGKFQFLRFGRLYPVHILTLCVFVLIECAKYVASLCGISSTNSVPFGQNNFVAFLEQLFLVHALGPTGNQSSFNGSAWSISTEFYTYLVFALIVLWTPKAKEMSFLLVSLAAVSILIVGGAPGYSEILRCETGFFIGCLTAWCTKRINTEIPSSISACALGSLVLFLLLKSNRSLDPLIYPISAALIFSLVVSRGGLLKSCLNSRLLVGLGTISYSLYMCHEAIIWVFNQIFRVILKRPEHIVNGQTAPLTSAPEAVVASAVVIFAILVASVFIYRKVERPFRESSREALLVPDLVQA